MSEYLLRFFSYHQPRRIRVVENILKSRRTVANLFWARQYGITNYLGARRDLTRREYDTAIKSLVDKRLLTVDENNQAVLTTGGVAVQQERAAYQYEPFFYDWFWVANTNRVQSRLLLAIQVVSEYSYQQSRYVPLQVSYSEMQVVKQWFRQNYRRDIKQRLYDELHRFGRALASEDEKLATDFFNMLVGHDAAGWTVKQASQQLAMTPADLQFMRHDELLAVAAYARQLPGLLQQLLGTLLNPTPLSRSSQTSLNLFSRGSDIETIAKRRRIKENTVREHLLEAAIMTPNQVDWDQLLPAKERGKLARLYPEAGPFKGDNRDNQAFYEYRLYQIYQEVCHE